MKLATATLLVIVFVLGCIHTKPVQQAKAPQDENPVIVRLISQHQTVTITADRAGRGPLYSVTDKSGRTLIANATADELRAAHPEIYRQLEPAIAGKEDTDSNRKPLDADASINRVPT